MSAAATPSLQPDEAGTAPAEADVLALCEIWLALDFPEPDAVDGAAPPDPQEVP